ncbi:MAG: hypothetical protein K2X67_15285 [Burkholderiales bacterium]|nr:hypothetical protein [Burkholderiales bacterium]
MPPCRTIADRPRTPGLRQRGVALLVILIIAGVLGVVFVTTVVGSAPDDADRDIATQAALARAKEALIAYAVTYMDSHPNEVPGYLPCPDLGTPSSLREGAASGTCGAAYTGPVIGDNSLGRLPWYTLDIEPLRDGYGECLWYAVASTYKNSPQPAILNWDSEGRFQIMGPNGTTVLAGATTADLVVAVVIAPGAAFGNQVRGADATSAPNCGGNYTASNYLDTGPASINNAAPTIAGQAQFVQGARTNTFNDRLIYITARDIWNAVARRTDLQTRFATLTRQVAVCIASYPTVGSWSDRRIPWTVDLPQSGYTLASQYRDADDTRFGRVPFDVEESNDDTGFSNDTLMASTAAGGRCSLWGTWEDAWWKNWKDHLFYGLSHQFAPNTGLPNSCSGHCQNVNSSGSYAGIVLFAGRGATMRTTSSQKGNAANYLSSENIDNDHDYTSPETGAFSSIYCIDTNFAGGATLVPPSGPTKFWVRPC